MPLVVREVSAHAVGVGLVVAAHAHLRDDRVRRADVGLDGLAARDSDLGVVGSVSVLHGERVNRALPLAVESGQEVVGAGRGCSARRLRRGHGCVAERRAVVARHVLDARALAYDALRPVRKARRGVNKSDVGVVERVERGGDDADGLDVRVQLDPLATVELAAARDEEFDVRRRREV